MSCPTCDHTMRNLNCDGCTYWCPRCGTVRRTNWDDDGDNDTVPQLVDRARALVKDIDNGGEYPGTIRLVVDVEECFSPW